MRHAETVTFGGSGLDRAAQLRTEPETLQRLQSEGDCVLPLWRGKVLLTLDDRTPCWLANSHPVFEHARDPAIFLGLDDRKARFARDVSRWDPDEDLSTLDTFLDPSEQRHPTIDAAVFAELRANMTALTPRDAELTATAKAMLGWHATHGFCAKCGHASNMAQAGWQRTCPACGAHHFPRTDPVVIMLILRGNSVLMGRSPMWPEGMYSLLAGFVEPGETIEAAVRREVFEEAGVTVGAVDYLASQPWPFPSSLMFGCRGIATSDEITIDPVEIEDAIWVTREDMVDVLAGTHETLKPARQGAIARFLIDNWLADRLDE